MLRRAFLRRMAFAALATWFLDLPLPEPAPDVRLAASVRWVDLDGDGIREHPVITTDENTRAWYDADGRFHMIRRTA